MTDGAHYTAWSLQPTKELIRQLLWLKKQLVADFEIPEWRVERAFSKIIEFRLYRAEQKRGRKALRARKRTARRTR